MQIHRLHPDPNDQRGCASRIGAKLALRWVGRQGCLAIDAQGFVKAGQHEKQAQLACVDDVLQRVQTVVARCIWDQQGLVIDDFHKTWVAPTRGRVHLARRV